ncbi:MAG: VOC family protein [Labilithrix sp.]|nr:VOC family protein [Labilithrix sp.]
MIRGGIVTLNVGDMKRAVRFYVETLGMKLVDDPGGGSAVIDAGDGFLIGLRERAAAQGAPAGHAPSIGLHPKIPLREAISILENRGVVFEVKDDGPATLAYFRDPDDNVLHLCQEPSATRPR